MSHYSAERCRWASTEALTADHTTMLGARLHGKLSGIGAVTLEADYAEIKRMFVAPDAREYGIGLPILEALLTIANAAGKTCVRLETGMRFAPAVALYRKRGFVLCEAFGHYRDTPINTYMALHLPKRRPLT